MHAVSQSLKPLSSTGATRLRGLAVLLAVVLIAAGCATGKGTTTAKTETPDKVKSTDTVKTTGATGKGEAEEKIDVRGMEMTTGKQVMPAGKPEEPLKDVITDSDKRHQWLGQKFASVIDAADKAFGEARVEDRQEIVRAKIGVKAEYIHGEGTDWNIPSNFRIPLPALERRANIFIDVTSSQDPNDVSSINTDSSASLAMLKKVTENIDVLFSFDVYGGWDVGPKVKFRFEHNWNPWNLFAEQQVFWRTDDGWGGRTTANFDYSLRNGAAFFRFTNKADYFEALHDVNYSSALMYRRKFFYDTALSVEFGAQYNPYNGDPEADNVTDPNEDGDNNYVLLRVVGKVWRPWLEYEIKPNYNYFWNHDDKWAWGIDFRISAIYESYLSGK